MYKYFDYRHLQKANGLDVESLKVKTTEALTAANLKLPKVKNSFGHSFSLGHLHENQ